MSAEQVSENVWFVLFAYVAAFLPWSLLAATDFIRPRWRTVRDTRVAGMYNAALSIIPAAYIVAYTLVQGLSNDYKEMSAALVALIFSLLNLLRTVWGLCQLHCFREWAINSIAALRAMGVLYHVKRANGSNDIADLADSLLVNNTIVDNQLAHGEARCFLSYGDIVFHSGADNEPPIARYLRVAAYGLRIMASLLFHYGRSIFVDQPLPKMKMTPFKPKEVWLNWSVAFASQGLAQWIQDFSVAQDPRDDPSYHLLTSKERWEKRAQFFGLQLVSSAWLQLWSEIRLSEGAATTSPFHWNDVWDERDTCINDGVIVKEELLRKAMECGTALPFGAPDDARDGARSGYHAYRRKLVQIVNDMPVLDEFDEKIEEFDIEKLEWLTVLLYIGTIAARKGGELSKEETDTTSESGSSTKQVEGKDTYSEPEKSKVTNNDEEMRMAQALMNLRAQVYLPGSSGRSTRAETEFRGTSQLFQCVSIGVPQLSAVFSSEENRHVSKIGEMIDAWMSLVCGDQMRFVTEVNGSGFWEDICSHGNVNGTNHGESSGISCSDFSKAVQGVHAEVEKRRIYYNFANEGNWYESCDQFVTFMGYGMEVVRSRLGSWVVRNAGEDESQNMLCPLIGELEVMSLELGRGLSETLFDDFKGYNLRHLGVQIRLLWELQQALAKYENDGPESASSIMLCLLSYPSVCMVVEEEGVEAVNSETVDGSVFLKFCMCVEEERRLHCMEKGELQHGSNRNLPRVKIYVEGGPQRIELMCTFSQRNGTLSVTLQLRGSEDVKRFEWVLWRDAFLGRLQGLKEWQEEHGIESANLHLTDGEMRAQVERKEMGTEEEVVCWSGWKPFRFEIMRFELESEGLLKEQFEAEEKTADHVFGIIEDAPWERRKNRRGVLLALQGEYSLYSWLGSFPCMRVTAVGYRDGSAVALRHAFLRVEEAFFGEYSSGGAKDNRDRSGLLLKDAEKCLDGGDWERAVSLLETAATIDGNERALDRCVLVLIEQSNRRTAALRVVSLLERFVAQIYAARGEEEYLISNETIYADKARKYVFPHCLRAMELSGDESLVPRRLSKLMVHVWMIDRASLREQTLFALQTLYSVSRDIAVLETLSRVAYDDYSSRKIDKEFQRNIKMIAERRGNMKEMPKTISQDLVMDSLKICKRFTGEVVKQQDGSMSPASVLLATLNVLDGGSTENDYKNAVALYRTMIEEGKEDVGTLVSWATLLIECEDRYTQHEGQVTEISRYVIERNDGEVLNALGNVLSFRDDKAMCSATAEDLYRRAAERDNLNAMNSLALLLVNGAEGVERNVKEAEGLYRHAVERDHVKAMVNLALLLEEGADGVERNAKEAEELYRHAIERGDVDAMYNLAVLLEEGAERVERNAKEAEGLYRRAVEHGDVSAMNNLAVLLKEGAEGVERNAEEAEELYHRLAILDSE